MTVAYPMSRDEREGVATWLGTTETLFVAAILNMAVCVGVALLPPVRHITLNPSEPLTTGP